MKKKNLMAILAFISILSYGMDKKVGANVLEGEKSLFVGLNSSTNNEEKVKIGANAKADSEKSIAIGMDSTSRGKKGIAIGAGSLAGAEKHLSNEIEDTIAIGTDAKATATDAIAIGNKANARTKYGIAIGTETKTDGIASIALGYKSDANSDSIAIGKEAVGYGKGVALGENAHSRGRSVAIGHKADSKGVYSYGNVVIGNESTTNENLVYSTALGSGAKVEANYSTALGSKSIAKKRDNRLGYDMLTNKEVKLEDKLSEVDKGKYLSLKSELETMIEDNNKVVEEAKVITSKDYTQRTEEEKKKLSELNDKIGENNKKINEKYTEYSKIVKAWKATYGEVSIGDIEKGITRQITGLAAGKEDTDAVNVAQLKSLDKKLEEENKTYFHVNTGKNKDTGDKDSNLGKMGDSAGAIGDGSITAGAQAKADGDNAIAIGKKAETKQSSGIAIGHSSKSEGNHSISIGKDSKASDLDSVALGHQARSTGSRSTALGPHSEATKDNALALGVWSKATMQGAIAIGSNSMSNASSAITIGENSKVETGAENSIAIGKEAKSLKKDSIVLGTKAEAQGEGSIVLGYHSKSKENAISIGKESEALSIGSVSLGHSSKAKGERSVSIGAYATAEKSNDIAIGLSSKASGGYSIAIGLSAKAEASSSTAIGINSKADIEDSVALGSESKTTKATSVSEVKIGELKYGEFAGKNPMSVVSIGTKNKERQLQHLAAGQISKESTDAINGSQLYATNMVLGTFVDSTKSILGGNASVTTNGKLTMTNIGDTGKNTVHEAIKALDDKIAQSIKDYNFNITSGQSGTGSASGSNSEKIGKDNTLKLIAGDNLSITQNGKDFTYSLNKELKGMSKIDFEKSEVSIGKDGLNNGGKKITNVADGTESTDAVNKGQLDKLENKIDKTKKEIDKKIEDIDKKVDKKIKDVEDKVDKKIEDTKKDLTDKIEKATKTLKTEITANNGEEANKTKGPVTLTSKKSDAGHNIYDISLATTQLKSSEGGKIETPNSEDSKKVANAGEVAKAINALGNNTLSFGADKGNTEAQSLNKNGGLKFAIKGTDYIKTEAKGNEVSVDLTDKTKKDIEKGVSANSGVANAVAMANLPQINGKGHNIAGSYGYYNGEHAFALGLSGTNEKVNLTYRASGSLNTRGNISLGAGLGYQFDNISKRNKELLTLKRNGNINLLDEKVYELEKQFNEIKNKLKDEIKELKFKFSELEKLVKIMNRR
ncbi:YadA-like family protein [Streptobacillus moniliformis]|uniref:YadA-like family protein n=1 Tax=Streptobacillus moniliformis TaxID=34105 RepID=UPI0007E31F68|nr:YadA-like family protein [Streptobacillus moniliformis]